jgi:hypothetical protein
MTPHIPENVLRRERLFPTSFSPLWRPGPSQV